MTETDSVSEIVYPLEYLKIGQSPKKSVIQSVIGHRQNPLVYNFIYLFLVHLITLSVAQIMYRQIIQGGSCIC
jgi:hypothetical protein